ncbi:GNAT family N-acetyltransferase [Kribbella sp. NPDC051587]|uniref:GNAT family N-acetyltransferase n=1 Tax=Kribbella sp. NPDC051587 TaxID=3364119 RepID=UPI0037A9F7A8
MTTLADILQGVEGGAFPIPDLSVTVVSPPSARESCVMAFTAHTVVAADVDTTWVTARLTPEDPAEPVSPPFLTALAAATGRSAHTLDAMLLAPALPEPAVQADLTEFTDHDHPRLARALQYRDDVRAYVDPYGGGVVIIGRGVAGRLECAIEVPESAQGQGHGRRLAQAARTLIPADAHLWAQVTPGNAASFRAFLAAGYQIVGSEILFF